MMTGSTTLIFRVIIFCADKINCAAIFIGSTVLCGIAPCPPFPIIVI
jgi:hypothetical protein